MKERVFTSKVDSNKPGIELEYILIVGFGVVIIYIGMMIYYLMKKKREDKEMNDRKLSQFDF